MDDRSGSLGEPETVKTITTHSGKNQL